MKDLQSLPTPDWRETIMSITDVVEQEQEVLRVHSTVIGTIGNFSASVGKAKSKKTFNVTAIAAAALINGTILNYTASFPHNKRRILYVDTEQSPYHCVKVMRRIFRMANLPLDKDDPNFTFLCLRKYSPEQRITLVDQAIQNMEGLGLVIIDGVRDLIYDINNPTEATNLMTVLMQWTDHYRIHVHTVLHQNKTDENARGHIGTELNNKAECILQVEKSNVFPEASVVSTAIVRDKAFEPFAFRVNSNGIPELDRSITAENLVKHPGRPRKEEDFYTMFSETEHRDALSTLFAEGDLGYGDIENRISEAYQKASGRELGHNKAVELIKFLRNKRMIVQEGKGKKYKFQKDFYY